ncbi:MAG: hypothetical protein JNL83_02485 [Myxococcales bacterium]|nr:hypothetical protein [Myxococcales bacterium]
MLPRLACLLLPVAASSCRDTSPAAAERVTHTAAQAPLTAPPPPCPGCTVDVPTTASGDLPILVVLHGNKEHAAERAAWWRDAATARGYVVLGLECPRGEGCTDGTWYEWNPAPTWITAQIDELARALPIDPVRRYVAAWSGGASYLGMHADKIAGLFAAVVFHGGGQPPRDRDDCPAGTLPSYFLVGDGNPAHPAAVRLKDYLAKCDQPLAWDLLPGAGHGAEAKALDRGKADEILDWMERHTPGDVIATR